MVKSKLESWFPGWLFETLDVRGRSGGLAMGWNAQMVRVLNIWGMESVLGMTFQALDHGEAVNVFNVYGSYLNRISFWDNLFTNSILRGDMVIIGEI